MPVHTQLHFLRQTKALENAAGAIEAKVYYARSASAGVDLLQPWETGAMQHRRHLRDRTVAQGVPVKEADGELTTSGLAVGGGTVPPGTPGMLVRFSSVSNLAMRTRFSSATNFFMSLPIVFSVLFCFRYLASSLECSWTVLPRLFKLVITLAI